MSETKQKAVSYFIDLNVQLAQGPFKVELGIAAEQVTCLYKELEMRTLPFFLTQDDRTFLNLVGSSNRSRVNPGELSELSKRIKFLLAVL